MSEFLDNFLDNLAELVLVLFILSVYGTLVTVYYLMVMHLQTVGLLGSCVYAALSMVTYASWAVNRLGFI